MKNFIIICFVFFFISSETNSQWYHQFSNVWSNIYSISSVNGETAWICGANGVILKTTNSGASWVSQNSGFNSTLGYIYFFDENIGIAAGNFGTILRTTNGGYNWYSVSSGTLNNINHGCFVSDSLFFLIGWNGTLLTSSDKGISWNTKPQISSSNFHSIDFWDSSIGWASTWNNGQIWKTTDGGNEWALKTQFGSLSLWQVIFVTSQKGFAVGDNGVILTSNDGGETWTQYFAGTSLILHAITFSSENIGWIVGKDETILKTTNGGDSWNIEHTGNDYEFLQVYFYNDSIGWILGTPGFWTGSPSAILYTDNEGYPVPVELVAFSCSLNEDGSAKIIWSTATETNNHGFELQRYKEDSENNNWEILGFLQGYGTTTEPKTYLFVDDEIELGNYKYRLKQIDYDGQFEYSNEIELNIEKPSQFFLNQNYPNPFNPSTKISWQLPVNGHQSLKVYDVLGNEVATLVDEYKSAGSYEVEFLSHSDEGQNLSSGIYFYKLVAGDFTETKKMILMK